MAPNACPRIMRADRAEPQPRAPIVGGEVGRPWVTTAREMETRHRECRWPSSCTRLTPPPRRCRSNPVSPVPGVAHSVVGKTPEPVDSEDANRAF